MKSSLKHALDAARERHKEQHGVKASMPPSRVADNIHQCIRINRNGSMVETHGTVVGSYGSTFLRPQSEYGAFVEVAEGKRRRVFEGNRRECLDFVTGKGSSYSISPISSESQYAPLQYGWRRDPSTNKLVRVFIGHKEQVVVGYDDNDNPKWKWV